VAKLLCKCENVLRDDDPESGLLLFRRGEFDVDLDAVLLRGRGREVWWCSNCGRLWVFWDRGGEATCYSPESF
jgi:hypothetical protein